MSRLIDAVLSWLKWPAAVFFALSIPQLLRADLGLLQASLRPGLAPFWGSAAAYVVLWWLVLRHRVWGSFLPTLLHELTHGLFALLTFHRVLSLRATWSSGGEIQYTGPGNWLITIAPYVFPLAMALAVPLSGLLRTDAVERLALLGVVFGFEFVAMARQVHLGQSDLRKVGLAFSAVFLPGAMLWTWGAVLALVAGGGEGMLAFLSAQWGAHTSALLALAAQGLERLGR